MIALRETILHLDLGHIHPRASIVKWHPSTQAAFDNVPDWQGEIPTVFPSLLMVLQHGFRMNDAHLQPLFALSTLNKATVLEAFDALRPTLMG